MKNLKAALCLCISLFILSCFVPSSFAQAPACPQVTISNPSINMVCPVCTTLTANVQGTVATTSYAVSSIPYNPYSFNTGTPVLVNIDDTWTSAISLPFCFQFFGNTYTKLLIGSNGILTFDLTNAGGFCPYDLTLSGGIPDAS